MRWIATSDGSESSGRGARWSRREGVAASSAREAVENSYAAGKSDEFVEPHVIGERAPMADGDQVICFNFRADRARELTAAIALDGFSGFRRPRIPKVGYVCMTEYDRSFALPLAFGPEDVRNTLAEVLAHAGLKNLRVAETEKYAHVTYFLNGGVEKAFPLEERALIPSSKVATYDLEPAMKAAAIATRVAEEIEGGKFDVIVMNFANPDMVGHTGKFEATVAAVEATDAALGVVIDALEKRGGVALITADHGNAEFMADPATGQAHTAHTTNPVPLILYDPKFKGRLKDGGTLADVAPTIARDARGEGAGRDDGARFEDRYCALIRDRDRAELAIHTISCGLVAGIPPRVGSFRQNLFLEERVSRLQFVEVPTSECRCERCSCANLARRVRSD